MAIQGSPNQRAARIRWTLLSAAGMVCGLIAALALGVPVQTVVGLLLVTPILTGAVGAVRGALQAENRFRRTPRQGR